MLPVLPSSFEDGPVDGPVDGLPVEFFGSGKNWNFGYPVAAKLPPIPIAPMGCMNEPVAGIFIVKEDDAGGTKDPVWVTGGGTNEPVLDIGAGT